MALGAALALAFGAPAEGSEVGRSSEYDVKAVFLYNFVQFVEWPSTAFKEGDDTFSIGILGYDPFGPYLTNVTKGEQVKGRRIQVVRIQRPEDVGTCSILFISKSEAERIPAILRVLAGKSVLTVSDMDDFASWGGMVQFVTEYHHIRLRINNEAAMATGLRISSKLLRPSEVVKTGER